MSSGLQNWSIIINLSAKWRLSIIHSDRLPCLQLHIFLHLHIHCWFSLFSELFQTTEQSTLIIRVLMVSRAKWLEPVDFVFIFGVSGSHSALVGRRSSEMSVLFPPAPLPWIRSFLSSSFILWLVVLIESPWVFRPLDVKSQPTEVHVLEVLLGLLSASLAIVLDEGVSFLRLEVSVPWDRSCSSQKIWRRLKITGVWPFWRRCRWKDSS